MTSPAQDKHMEPQTDDNSTYIQSGDIQEVMQTVVTCNVSVLLCAMFCVYLTERSEVGFAGRELLTDGWLRQNCCFSVSSCFSCSQQLLALLIIFLH